MRAKKFIAAAAFAAVALFSGINAFNNSNEVKLSDLALANVEALANDGEIGPGGVVIKDCYARFDPALNDNNVYVSCDPNYETGVYYECGSVSYDPPAQSARKFKCYVQKN